MNPRYKVRKTINFYDVKCYLINKVDEAIMHLQQIESANPHEIKT